MAFIAASLCSEKSLTPSPMPPYGGADSSPCTVSG